MAGVDTSAPERRLLTTQQVADWLGVPISTIYRWRHLGEGPRGMRIGKHVRFFERDVLEWLDGQQGR